VSNEPMRGIRLRYWLPVANLVIDAALLGSLAWSIHVWGRHERSSREVTAGSVRSVAYLQEGQAAVGWDLIVPPPQQVRAIMFGTLPAGAVSAGALPVWRWRTGLSLRWVCLHESLALLVWLDGWPNRRRGENGSSGTSWCVR